jgi:hypothetical protein
LNKFATPRNCHNVGGGQHDAAGGETATTVVPFAVVVVAGDPGAPGVPGAAAAPGAAPPGAAAAGGATAAQPEAYATINIIRTIRTRFVILPKLPKFALLSDAPAAGCLTWTGLLPNNECRQNPYDRSTRQPTGAIGQEKARS